MRQFGIPSTWFETFHTYGCKITESDTNNFRQIPRFDRCTTCHTAMQKTKPASAGAPAYPQEQLLEFTLSVAAQPATPRLTA